MLNRAPRSACNAVKHSREHWARKKGSWKPKRAFPSFDAANN